MPTPGFSLSTATNTADYGASYTLFGTDEAPLTGTVFTDMGEHVALVDGVPERRSMVIVRFLGLRAHGEPLGNPRVLARFVPGDPGRGAAAAVCLGEPGRLHLDLGHPLHSVDPDLRELVSDTVIEITAEFLTDERAARHRHFCADARRQAIATELDTLDALQQCGYRRMAAARADADAAWALVQALHQQH
ncbi:hypothetical protein IU487_33535 [Nocardia puris]|uniref:Uncharacterized protein n=1 Tax=Nocardia puris TaxID=208602 RepID=A0A366CV53_9NOCA|nr:hypothetical protein [Nocardia puris]MBF6215923.1 hypothetical protein [Nocardia puris]RBO79948.1 hypothetical protein DFR74_12924 [Nocardia puris]